MPNLYQASPKVESDDDDDNDVVYWAEESRESDEADDDGQVDIHSYLEEQRLRLETMLGSQKLLRKLLRANN